MKGLILFAAINQMYAVLNLLIINEKAKNDITLLLVKENPLIYCQRQKQQAPHLDCLHKLSLLFVPDTVVSNDPLNNSIELFFIFFLSNSFLSWIDKSAELINQLLGWQKF